jgi:hypothetical protein
MMSSHDAHRTHAYVHDGRSCTSLALSVSSTNHRPGHSRTLCSRALEHTHTHTHTHTHHTLIPPDSPTRTHSHARTHTHSHTHSHTSAHRQTHSDFTSTHVERVNRERRCCVVEVGPQLGCTGSLEKFQQARRVRGRERKRGVVSNRARMYPAELARGRKHDKSCAHMAETCDVCVDGTSAKLKGIAWLSVPSERV